MLRSAAVNWVVLSLCVIALASQQSQNVTEDPTTKFPVSSHNETTLDFRNATDAFTTTRLPALSHNDTTLNFMNSTDTFTTTGLPALSHNDNTLNLMNSTDTFTTTGLSALSHNDTTLNFTNSTYTFTTRRLPASSHNQTTLDVRNATDTFTTAEVSTYVHNQTPPIHLKSRILPVNRSTVPVMPAARAPTFRGQKCINGLCITAGSSVPTMSMFLGLLLATLFVIHS